MRFHGKGYWGAARPWKPKGYEPTTVGPLEMTIGCASAVYSPTVAIAFAEADIVSSLIRHSGLTETAARGRLYEALKSDAEMTHSDMSGDCSYFTYRPRQSIP